jgi:hypothetical protein
MQGRVGAVVVFVAAVFLNACGISGHDAIPQVELGETIDRAGRPLISKFLLGTFAADTAANAKVKDRYNAEGDTSKWQDFAARIAEGLAAIDGFDRDCNNNFNNAGDNSKTAYDKFAKMLADDRLYINSVKGRCRQYLAVEVNSVKKSTPQDCGGRAPGVDIVQTTYSMFINGSLNDYDDFLVKDDQAHSIASFPFLAAP